MGAVRSTMQDVPLTVGSLVHHARTVHGRAPVSTAAGPGSAPSVTDVAGVHAAAVALSHGLRALGVTGDRAVATLEWNTAGHLAAYVAVPSMGAVLHPVNPRLAAEDIAHVLDVAGDVVVLVSADLVPVLAGALAAGPRPRALRHVVVTGPRWAAGRPGVPDSADVPDPADVPDLAALAGPAGLSGVAVHDIGALTAGHPADVDWTDPDGRRVDETDAAAIGFSSGTTGRPRGVAWSHRSVYLHSMGMALPGAFGMGPADTVAPIVPMAHVLAWGLPYSSLLVGAGQVLPNRWTDAASLAALFTATRPTRAAAVPSVWTALLAHLDARPDGPDVLAGVAEVLVGGAAVTPALIDGFRDRYGVRVLHAWGMTETSPLGAVARPDTHAHARPAELHEATVRSQRLSQGRLATGVRARVVGADGSVLPADGVTVGELQVRGPWVAAGYLTDEAGGVDGTRRDWLATGDLASLDGAGYLRLTDRIRDVVKSGGEWISPSRLEGLLRAHPGVADVVVLGVADERWGERPLAAVVPADPSAPPAAADLAAHLATSLPRWQVPQAWVVLDAVPLAVTGKPDKHALRAGWDEGVLRRLP